MCDTEELDDLHQSILSLCAEDVTVIHKSTEVHTDVCNDVSQREDVPFVIEQSKSSDLLHTNSDLKDGSLSVTLNDSCDRDQTTVHSASSLYNTDSSYETVDETNNDTQHVKKPCDGVQPTSGQLILSESSSHDNTDSYETVDEISCSSSDITAWSPTKYDQSLSEIYQTVQETVRNTSVMGYDEKLSPIKDVGNDSRFLLSAPSTPSFINSKSHLISKFAQSTPLQSSKNFSKYETENLSKIVEETESIGNSNKENESESTILEIDRKSMFTIDESDFSDMSFDDLLLDSFMLCKGKDLNWKKMIEKRKPEKKTSGNLQWKKLNADQNVNSISKLKNSEIHEQMQVKGTDCDIVHKSSLDDTITENISNTGNMEKAEDKGVSRTEYKILKRIKEIDEMLIKIENSQLKNEKQDISSEQNKNQTVSHLPSTSKGQCQNISKINIDNIFADDESKQIEKNNKHKGLGRFSNFTSSFLSDIEVTEDEVSDLDVSGDILGLNNFTYSEADNIDLDEEDEETLLDETITDLPESIKNKYKLQEQGSILTRVDHTEKNKTVIETATDVNKNILKLSETGDALKSIADAFKNNEEKVEVLKIEESAKKDVEDLAVSTEIADIQKITCKIDYEAERKYFKIESPEVKDIVSQWGSLGIQDPDINLTCATNYRFLNGCRKGLLEGTHISCIWLQESVDAEKDCSSPMKKRQKLDSEAHNRQDILNLEHELDEINFRHRASLQRLFQEWQLEKQRLEDRNRPMLQNLQTRQLVEMKENYFRFRQTNVPLFQMNVIRLHAEHEQQKAEFKARFNLEMEKLKHIFQRREVDIERNFSHRNAQLKSLIDQIKHVNSDGKYGHHVTAQFVKGPCRSNNLTRSLVEVYVPSDVATCILKEDEVFDSFYKYA